MLRKHLRTAPLLILVLSVFRGHTLTCRRSEYLIGDRCCTTCSAGSRVGNHCTKFRSTSCLDCDEGTFLDLRTGLTKCFPCTRCDSGSGLKIKTACTTTSNTVCEPLEGFYCTDEGTFLNLRTGLKKCFPCTRCDSGSGLKIQTACTTTSDTVCEPLEGFYCTDSSENGCVVAEKHSSCQPGQYIRQKGTALKNTECSACSEGTFSDGTLFTSCQPHTQCEALNLQLIKPGNASTDAECGEQDSGFILGAVIGLVVVLVTYLVIGLVIALFFKKKNDTGKRIPDNLQQCFRKNKHPPKEEEQQQGGAVVND